MAGLAIVAGLLVDIATSGGDCLIGGTKVPIGR